MIICSKGKGHGLTQYLLGYSHPEFEPYKEESNEVSGDARIKCEVRGTRVDPQPLFIMLVFSRLRDSIFYL